MEGVLTMTRADESRQTLGQSLRIWRELKHGAREVLSDKIAEYCASMGITYTTYHIRRVEEDIQYPTIKLQRAIFQVCAEEGLEIPEGWERLRRKLDSRPRDANVVYRVEHPLLKNGQFKTRIIADAAQTVLEIQAKSDVPLKVWMNKILLLDKALAPVLYYVSDELRANLSEHLGGPVSVAATRL